VDFICAISDHAHEGGEPTSCGEGMLTHVAAAVREARPGGLNVREGERRERNNFIKQCCK
jgi:hypothetical protein